MTKKLFLISLFLLVSAFILNIALYFIYPNISRLKKENPKKTAFMEYTEKRWKEKGIKRKIARRWVRYSRISPCLVKAVLIAEDDKFWSHEGFDIEGIEKAIEKNIKAKKFKAGGSTISQQLAKNLYLSPSKSPVRKLKEAILTWRIEKALSKRRILELYLNVAEWGEGIFGIEAAARHYYGKSASELGPEESARLAAVLPNPKRYNPMGSSRYVANRSRLIYRIMVRRGIVIQHIEEEVAEMEQEGTESAETPSEGPVEAASAPLSPEEANPSINEVPPAE